MGDGPTHSTLQRALDIRVASAERWLPRDGYRSLNLGVLPALIPTTSILDWKVDGSLTALVMIQLLLEPYPVDPFVVYAAFFENGDCFDFLLSPYREYQPQHLLAMIRDQNTRKLISALLAFTSAQTFTTEEVAKDPLLSRAVAWYPLSNLHKPRDAEEHKTLMGLLLCDVLVGHPTPWDLRQFKAFATGLRLGICGVDDIVKVYGLLCSRWILGLTTALL